jgi:addiction module HigA family antidote
MSIVYEGKRLVPPCHPGEMLREDFLPEYGLTPRAFANAIGVSRQTIAAILQERRALTPLMALRCARFFGNSPEFWLRAQQAYDLWRLQTQYRQELQQIQQRQAA